MFGFEELCGRPVAAADYIGLCNIFHTLVLKGVPIFSAANRNEAYRCAPLLGLVPPLKVLLPRCCCATWVIHRLRRWVRCKLCCHCVVQEHPVVLTQDAAFDTLLSRSAARSRMHRGAPKCKSVCWVLAGF